MQIIAEYGIEIFFGLVSASLMGFCKHLLKQKSELESLAEQNKTRQYREMILDEIEPLTEEIRRVKKELIETNRQMEANHIADKAAFEERLEVMQRKHTKEIDMIVNSYKFRLIQLCKTHLKDGHISSNDFEQITEMYKLYSGLGGNGQAKEYYDRVVDLPITE